MASLHRDDKSPNYSIRFRYQGRNINRSLGTRDKRKASGIRSRVEETIRLIERGRIEIPANVDPIEFILADGQIPENGPETTTKKAKELKAVGLSKFFAVYREQLPEGRKEESTLEGERIHLKHLKRHLGSNRTMQSISKSDLQTYVTKRLKETHNQKPIQPDTVKKELVTFRMLWNWGVEEGLLIGPSPTKHVVLPLTDEKPPFMTRKEIERIISRGGLSEEEQSTLWEAVYLETAEVDEVLKLACKAALAPFIYPMLVFVAHTSARRSEMMRSLVDDIDFRSRTVLLREKKKSRTKAMTFRRVDMSPLLFDVMQKWIKKHPGGQHTFCQLRGFRSVTPLTSHQAGHHLKQTMKKSKWSFIKGFHVFRHSFASNFAAAGVDQRVIDEFMGHQTEEMRKRYQHLFPKQRRSAVESVFGTSDENQDVIRINKYK